LKRVRRLTGLPPTRADLYRGRTGLQSRRLIG
jgi:hypothetical protein